ncbi:Hypothetical protein, putative [Bodo saltans]|uniref:Uncharacterized protein n=1 Tax=Bodo saltans TaxID=75058 RepID=A0A0S4JN11_BODSA|nr:Hypothetical protein, putative [Bodo saltans]|eukprot:CUG90661.1 Hypothetical protein, putative [Bodo saltans]
MSASKSNDPTKSSSAVKPAGKSSLTATDTPTSTASAAAAAMARNRRRSSSTQPGGNSLASFPDDDGSAIDDDHSYSRASTVAEVGVQWEDTPGGARNSNSNSSASLLLPRQKSGGAAMKSVPSSFRQITASAAAAAMAALAAASSRCVGPPLSERSFPDDDGSAIDDDHSYSRASTVAEVGVQWEDTPGGAGNSNSNSSASLLLPRQKSGGAAMKSVPSSFRQIPHAATTTTTTTTSTADVSVGTDPVFMGLGQSEIHRLVAELQEQGPIAPMVVPRALRRDNTIALLQLLAPAEREEFSALAEQLELIPPRVRHVTVHSDSTNDPKNRQRRMEEQQAALESKLCTPQSSVAAARVSSSQLQQSPLTTEEYYRGNSPDRSDEETATTTRDGDAHSLDQEDDAHHNNNGALVVAVAPVAAARNSSSLPPPSVTTMAHHHHSHQNGIGALMHGLIAAVPSFLNSVLESVATASSPSSSLGQSSHVGLLCQRSLWQVASLLTATPFEDGANASSSKNDPLHAAFTRATRPISELSSSSTSPSSSALYQNAAIAARWCHVLLWALEVCRQQVESAASEMDQWSVPPTTTTHQQQQHQVNGAWEQQLNTSIASGQRSKAPQQQQNINTSIELSRPHSAMSSAILRREHQSGVATLPRSMVNQQQAPQQQQPVRVPRFSPTPLSSNSVGPSATWSSAANRLQSMHEQHKKFFENAQQQHNQQPDLLSEHLAFVAASSSPNVAADIRQRGRQVGRAGGLLSNGASTTARDMYRYGRADVVAAGRMLPRQFTADFDCAVRQTLVSPLEFVVAPDHLGEMITDESALMLLPPRPNSAIPSMVGSKLRLSLHANSTYNVRAQSAGAAGSKSGAGGADDNHKGNQSDDDNMEPRGGGNEATEWTAENALYDEFVKQKRLERVILSQVNSVEGHNNNAPTIRCGSAPLARHGSASGGKRPPIAEAAAPAPSMGDVVVYKGHEQQQQQQTRSTSPTTGDPTVGHEASVVHNGGVRPGRTLKAVYSRQSSAGRGRPSQSKSLNESTYVQPPLPLPEILPVETGAALQRPGSSSLRDKLRSVVQTNGDDSALAKSGASVSASLTSITVAQNTTQRRTIPPPSVFQWQRVVQQSGPFQEQQQLQQPENVGASNVSTTKAVVATTPSSSPAMSSALRNIPQRNNASGTPQPQQSSSTSAPPSKANAPTVLITSEASTHNSNINSSTNTKSQPQQQRTTTTGPTTMLLSSPTAAGQRRTSGGTKPPAAIKLTKSSSVEDSVFASIGTPVQQWSINPDLEASGGFHFRPDDVVDGDADPFAVPDPSFALT